MFGICRSRNKHEFDNKAGITMNILDMPINGYDMRQTLALIAGFLHEPKDQRGFFRIITINPEGVMLAQKDDEFRAAIESADIVTPDGVGILWAAKKLGKPMPERVTGIDLLIEIGKMAATKGLSIYFLGAKDNYAQLAAENLQKNCTGLYVAGYDNGYFRDREPAVIANIVATNADILIAALGMPYQEKWLASHAENFPGMLLVGVGGSFDVLAEKVKRAPALWQKLKIEWLWRLFSEPSRIPRYMAIPRFIRAVNRQRKMTKQQNNS